MIGLAYALTIAGLVDSAYLLYISTQPDCPVGTCAPITVFSLPHYLPALLGLAWFLVSAIVFARTLDRRILLLWRFSGVAGSAFLGTYALLNSYYCPFCFTAYGLGIALIAISEKIHG